MTLNAIRRGQRRYRVVYATLGPKGKPNDPRTWCNTNDLQLARVTALTLTDIPNVVGSYVYDRGTSKRINRFGNIDWAGPERYGE